MKQPPSHILVIFGASGDLTKRKLIPALYHLYRQNLLPENFAILGTSRTGLSDITFRERVSEFIINEKDCKAICNEFLKKLYYQSINTSEQNDYIKLKNRLTELRNSLSIPENYIFYLSTPPNLYPIIPENLAAFGLNKPNNGFSRLIVEKPFGFDLESGQSLNKHLLTLFEEDQIYRIDHYLGKETVQNLLVTRFSNGIFEPLWNRNFIHHIEITSAESLGVEERGGYYDQSGALRDMVQNHLLQLVALVAMEPPTVIEANALRNETLKVLQSLRAIKENEVDHYVIRGQYIESMIRGKYVKGYRQENGVNPESRTETYFAMKFFIDNWRWGGIPFYIRTGKKLPTRATEIVIHFNETPHRLFFNNESLAHTNNQLIIRIQPDEGILLKLGMKVPGQGFKAQTVNMDFHYSELSREHLPTAYERLLLDCMQGDATLYARGDAVEAAWKFVQPIIEAWKTNPEIKIYGYPAGTWGPIVADQLIEGFTGWRYPCKNLSNDGTYCEL